MMEQRHPEILRVGLVDSRLKLHVLLLFAQHPQLCSNKQRLHEWLRESPWDLEEALEALADAGFLVRVDRGKRHYRPTLSSERQMLLQQLIIEYDNPLQRDMIYALVRRAEQERLFQEALMADRRPIGALSTFAPARSAHA
jgi:hypothetical protein